LIRQDLRERHDRRTVVTDPHARYFGAELGERSLVPGNNARLGEIRLENWSHTPILAKITVPHAVWIVAANPDADVSRAQST